MPCFIRWPGVLKPGTIDNEIHAHIDMLPTLVAAAGEPNIVEKFKQGYKAGNKTFKVHLDGYNMIPFWKGEVKANPRPGFLYWSDDGDLMALRYGNWKVHFAVQRAHGFHAWGEPLVQLRVPWIVTCAATRSRSTMKMRTSTITNGWPIVSSLLYGAQALVGMYLKTFEEFPPRQKPASFSIDEALEKARQKQKILEGNVGVK